MTKFICCFSVALTLLVAASPASAQLVVDKLWIDLDSTASGRDDVLLKNESTIRNYISVSLEEVTDPGLANEKHVEIANPDEMGLLVSPSRLILEPTATRALRVVSINPPLTKDRIYRLKVTPRVGDITAPGVLGEDRAASMVMLMAYDLIIVVRPVHPEAKLQATRQGNSLTLTNGGNSNTVLLDGRVCTDATELNCTRLDDRRMYAGASWQIALPTPDAKVRFREKKSVNATESNIEF